jgi:anthranilate synthase component 2
MARVLVFDNYDSFTYNLVHMVEKILHAKITVCKNDEWSLEMIGQFDKILLSPGPGIPEEAGMLKKVILEYASSKSILGICLGHQAIGEVFGAKLENLKTVFHGVASPFNIIEPENPIFEGLSKNESVGRYHSWVVSKNRFPDCLTITGFDHFGNIMGLRHKSYDVQGLQFHPESILTRVGEKILTNWLKN